MAKSGIKSGLRSARKQHIINNNNESRIATPTAIQAEVTVKEEPVNEEFKEFAETAMNELLGWYGYGSSGARDSGGAVMARPASYKSNSNSNSSSPTSPLHANGCGWCGKSVDENNGLLSGQSSFCSELCFSQSRRANFKKNKTCDWCRHVRHTVSYVDFQEGSAQLQFCSDKCLNQYKMHIFCRETQAHLDFHPHLLSSAGGDSSAGGSGNIGLITPDLWLKDCKTPPEEDTILEDDRMREGCNRSPDLRNIDKVESPRKGSSADKVPKLIPIITLAPTSSLLASPSGSLKRSPLIKKTRNKRKRFSSATITSQSTPTTSTSSTNSLILDEEVAQDLRVRHNITPPLRTIPNLHELQEKQSNLIKTNFNQSTAPPVVLNNLTTSSEDISTVPVQPRTRSTAPPVDVRLPNPSNNQQESNRPPTNISMMPPVTVLVPYPIMIPVPLPIPIPLPVSSFLRAYFGAKANDVKDQQATNARIDQELMRLYKTTDKIDGLDKAMDVEGAASSSGVAEEEEIVVDVVEDEPKSPRMLRRRKKMVGASGEVKGGTSKVIRKKI